MQIVIEIPEDIYENIILRGYVRDEDSIEIGESIMNGTPLPKGHGRLIDEKEVYKKFYCRCLAGAAKDVLEETSTIIESDKEAE